MVSAERAGAFRLPKPAMRSTVSHSSNSSCVSARAALSLEAPLAPAALRAGATFGAKIARFQIRTRSRRPPGNQVRAGLTLSPISEMQGLSSFGRLAWPPDE